MLVKSRIDSEVQASSLLCCQVFLTACIRFCSIILTVSEFSSLPSSQNWQNLDANKYPSHTVSSDANGACT